MAQLAGSDDTGHANDCSDPAVSEHLSLPKKPAKRGAPRRQSAASTPASSSSIDAVSVSLRQAYESTLHEEIPDAFMDLLRKLG